MKRQLTSLIMGGLAGQLFFSEGLSAQTSLQFNQIATTSPGSLAIELQGPTDRTWVVESSTNLIDWSFLWEATPESIPVDGIVSPVFQLGEASENVYLRAVYMGPVNDPVPVEALVGNASSPAIENLPDLGMPSVDPDKIAMIDGQLPVSLPDILATIADGTTVQQMNDLLSIEGLTIAGCLNDLKLVLLCDQTIDSGAALRTRLDQLKGTGLFSAVAPNIGMDIPADPNSAVPTLNSVGSPSSEA